MDQVEFDRADNILGSMDPEALPGYVADWRARGAAVLATRRCELDLRYGPAPSQRLERGETRSVRRKMLLRVGINNMASCAYG
jgi:hypothetical protein